MWHCKNCNEEIEEHLTYCWRCATERFDPEPVSQPEAKAGVELAEPGLSESGKEPTTNPPAERFDSQPLPQPEAKANVELAEPGFSESGKESITNPPAERYEPPPASKPEAKAVPGFAELGLSKSGKESIANCYKDAYITANRTISLGNTIKLFACIIGAVIIFIGINAAIDHGYMAVAGNVLGILIAVVLYNLGRLVSAQGRGLKTKIDTAVNASSFLTLEDIQAIMFSEKTG